MEKNKRKIGWQVSFYEVNDINAYMERSVKDRRLRVDSMDLLDYVDSVEFINNEQKPNRHSEARVQYMWSKLTKNWLRNGVRERLPSKIKYILDDAKGGLAQSDCEFYDEKTCIEHGLEFKKGDQPFVVVYYPLAKTG